MPKKMQKILIMNDGRLATEQRLKHFNQSLTYFFLQQIALVHFFGSRSKQVIE